jgi:hypothetical protein
MQRLKKDTQFILAELKCFFRSFPSKCGMSCVNELLESLAKRLDSELAEKIVEMLPGVGLKKDGHSCEAFLNMYFTTRNFQDVKTLVAEMRAEHISFTIRSSMVIIKAYMKLNDLDMAIQHFREFKATWTCSPSSSPSMAPSHLAAQLVELACKEHRLGEIVEDLYGINFSTDVINSMLSECVQQKSLELACSVEKIARELKLQFTDTTYSLLIKTLAADSVKVHAIFDQAMTDDIQLTADFACSVLSFCAQSSNVEMAEVLYKHMRPDQPAALSAFIRFFA